MAKLSIRDLDLVGKRVLIRVDFNVPLSKDEVPRILDDTRGRQLAGQVNYAALLDAAPPAGQIPRQLDLTQLPGVLPEGGSR